MGTSGMRGTFEGTGEHLGTLGMAGEHLGGHRVGQGDIGNAWGHLGTQTQRVPGTEGVTRGGHKGIWGPFWGHLGTSPEWQKPPAQREREQLLLEELVALVNRRDRLVRDRHRRESRALEEDEELRRSLEPRRRRFGRRETCGIC
ncbi:EH domain-binding protein 1-like protein 1 [Melospiza melodia melodia]|uniref:EH domain-binding protein 1-like protein 1 n=1 Tax=Melospiza melodia melodia TaxID=1914991 RepID=UPI002FD19D8E